MANGWRSGFSGWRNASKTRVECSVAQRSSGGRSFNPGVRPPLKDAGGRWELNQRKLLPVGQIERRDVLTHVLAEDEYLRRRESTMPLSAEPSHTRASSERLEHATAAATDALGKVRQPPPPPAPRLLASV